MKLKVNLQKMLAVVVSVSVITFSFISVSVSADETTMTNQEYYAAQSYLIAKYKDGEISYSEFQERSQAVTDEFVAKNTVGGVLHSGALNASNTFNAVAQKIGATVQKYGDIAKDYISDYVSGFMNSYLVLSDKPTTSTDGYGAVLKSYNGGNLNLISYCDYIIYDERDDFYKTINIRRNEHYRNNSINFFNVYDKDGMSQTFKRHVNEGTYRVVYGDVRYSTGEQAPTDDKYETISDYDFTEAPEKELEDLLKKILEAIELNEPDLSSIEGILKAIYAKLGTLDSDDDASALSLINSAINKLVAENKESNEAIIEKLEKLKLENDNQAILDKLDEIFPKYNYDTDISRTEELKILFLSKWSFVEELKTLIGRFMSSYEKKSSLGSMDNVIHVQYHPSNGDFGNIILNHNGAYDIRFDMFEPYLPTIRGLIAAFIYLSYAFNTYRKIPSYIRGGDAE